MQHPAPPWRLALLAAALLSACAAGGVPGTDRGPRSPSGQALTGAFGNYLVGRFAASETDTKTAADTMLAALRADPDNPEVLNRTFLATLLDGRSDALRLARRLPDNPAGNRLRAVNALHAALIADLAQRPREAERFARMAVADQPNPPWRLAVLAAGV